MNISVKDYLDNAIMHAESTYTGNYKACNNSASEIEQMNNSIANLLNDEAACDFIDEIIDSNCANAIMWITPVCKKKNYKLETIKSILLSYLNDKSLGILSFNAAMLLKTL